MFSIQIMMAPSTVTCTHILTANYTTSEEDPEGYTHRVKYTFIQVIRGQSFYLWMFRATSGNQQMLWCLTWQQTQTILIYLWGKLKKWGGKYRKNIIKCLQQYDQDFSTPWNRTDASLYTEWDAHNIFSPFDRSAQDVDFDNREENCGYLHYVSKAWNRFWDKFRFF